MRGHHKPHTPEARGRQSAAAKKRRKVPCRFCPKRLSVSAIGRHEQACKLNPDSLAAKRLAEVAICPRDLREFYPWKRTKSPKGGVSWQRNEFCCRTCAIEFRHDQRRENGGGGETSSGGLPRRENGGKRLVDWNRRNRWVAQRAQAGRPKPNLRIIRPEAQLRAAALLSEYTGATIVTSPKIDGRLLVDHSGTANPRA